MKYLIPLFLILLFTNQIHGQNPVKGFTFINDGKYDEAFSVFSKSIARANEQVASHYGLALLYMNSKTPYFNIDTAYKNATESEQAFNDLDKEEKEALYNKYQITGTKIAILKYNISVDAFKQVNVESEEELSAFIKCFPNERTAAKAKDIMEQLQILNNYTDDKSLEYYENIVEKYPNHIKAQRAWKRLYDLSTGDGEFLSMEQFLSKYENFPLDSLAKQDIRLIQQLVNNKCMENMTSLNELKCREYITKAAPKYSAFTVLQNILKKDIDAKNWTRVKQELALYESYFGNDKLFNALKSTISRNDLPVESHNLGNRINTPMGHEYSPVISANGKHLYFCGMKRVDNLGGEDIFVSERNGDEWGKPTLIPLISTKLGNEAPEALSTDETKMVLYYNGDIFYSSKSTSGWQEMRPFPSINTRGWDGDAVYSADGKAVVFSSEGWGKQGIQFPSKVRSDGFDIYVSVKTSNGWSKPINLGTTINTPWCDRYPFLHPDGKTLYFSSKGHGSLGGSDVYRSVKLSDTSWTQWSEPENLGKYINTTGDDNGYKISTDGTQAFYSVNNNKNIDIYSTNLPEQMRPGNVAIIAGVLRDEMGKPIQADITVEDLTTGTELAIFSSDPLTGSYVIVLPMGRDYGFFISKDGFFPVSNNINLSSENKGIEWTKDITVTSLQSMVDKGLAVTINNIFFDTDKFELKTSSNFEIKRLIDILNKHKDFNVSIEGHTDNDGTAVHNQQLSEDRANAVRQKIIASGIAPQRIRTKGFGSTMPVSGNFSASEKQRNRRVEIRFYK